MNIQLKAFKDANSKLAFPKNWNKLGISELSSKPTAFIKAWFFQHLLYEFKSTSYFINNDSKQRKLIELEGGRIEGKIDLNRSRFSVRENSKNHSERYRQKLS